MRRDCDFGSAKAKATATAAPIMAAAATMPKTTRAPAAPKVTKAIISAIPKIARATQTSAAIIFGTGLTNICMGEIKPPLIASTDGCRTNAMMRGLPTRRRSNVGFA